MILENVAILDVFCDLNCHRRHVVAFRVSSWNGSFTVNNYAPVGLTMNYRGGRERERDRQRGGGEGEGGVKNGRES